MITSRKARSREWRDCEATWQLPSDHADHHERQHPQFRDARCPGFMASASFLPSRLNWSCYINQDAPIRRDERERDCNDDVALCGLGDDPQRVGVACS
jgi:hypothetical protein